MILILYRMGGPDDDSDNLQYLSNHFISSNGRELCVMLQCRPETKHRFVHGRQPATRWGVVMTEEID